MNKILLIGHTSEKTFSYVRNHLEKNIIEYDVLDFDSISHAKKVSLIFGKSLLITIDELTFNLDDYNSFYCRYYYKESTSDNRNDCQSKLLASISSYLQVRENAIIINRPLSGIENASKLLQLNSLKNFGFNIPKTINTQNSDFVKEKLELNKWVSKGCSGERTMVVEYSFDLFADLDLMSYCPTQFQELIKGYNVRVHVIGNKAIAVKITSENIDYRYVTKNNTYDKIDLPKVIFDRCINYARQHKLIFGGFDFLVANDKWFILEVNPMPGFDFYDRKINGEIVQELSSLLSTGIIPKCDFKYDKSEPFIGKDRRKLKL